MVDLRRTLRSRAKSGAAALFGLALCAAPDLGAQTRTVYSPDKSFAENEGGRLTFWAASPFDVRRQIVIDKSSISSARGSRLTSLSFRRNGGDRHNSIAGRVHVEVWVSNTSRDATQLVNELAKNRGRDHRRVFKGWIDLPATRSPRNKSERWRAPYAVELQLTNSPVYTGQHLLIETVTRVDPKARPWWPIDATDQTSAGTVSRRGWSCLPKFGLQPAGAIAETAVVGSSLRFYIRGPRLQMTGLFMMGFQRGYASLWQLGAPACSLFMVPVWYSPMVFQKRAASARAFGSAEQPLHLPWLPSLKDQHIYAQWLIVDPSANRLGLALSNLVDAKIALPGTAAGRSRQLESFRGAQVGNIYSGRSPVLRLRFTRP